MSSLALIVLLCLSVHACDARHLGVTNKETTREVHLLSKGSVKPKSYKIITPSRLRFSISVEEKFMVEKDGKKPYESWGGANTRKQKDLEALWKKDTRGATSTSGNKVLASSWPEGLQHATKIEGWKRQARSMLASAPQNTEEAIDSKEDEVVEDVVVMDYAQPHRKPPIHNKEP
ncbi:uncharacterized protein LOC132304028 isoform X2 [Cornus florida]|uniref:uncharacterized protein LOC132304028 isoform X2 n=1 Tax=Cornus florida TaxID=4283 RepID=UPI00289FDDD7|nr:uncharacterized protein LOC132304028 isoform X2 [Cornus florida]